MKTASDKLFRVVKSMTKAEKRYFKLAIERYQVKQSRRSIELFDALNKLNIYEESELLKILKTPQLKKNLSMHKKILLDTLLQALKNQYLKKYPIMAIQEKLDYALLMRDRNLPEIAMNLVNEAVAKCKEYECWEKQLEAYELKRSILVLVERTKAIFEEELVLLEEEKGLLADINERIEMLKVQNHLQQFRDNSYQVHTEEDIHLINELGKQLDKHLTLEAPSNQITLQFALADFYYNKKDYVKQIEALDKIGKLFEGNPKFIQKNPNHYCKYLQCRMLPNYHLRNFEAMKALKVELDRLQTDENTPIITKELANLNATRIVRELVIAGEESAEVFEAMRKEWFNQPVQNVLHAVLVLRLFLSYDFMVGDYQKLLDTYFYIDKKMLDKGPFYTTLTCKYIVMATYFELDNVDMLSYWVRNIRYTLKREGRYGDIEKLILNFFQKGPQPFQKEYQKLLAIFHQRIVYKDDCIGNVFLYWLMAKASKKTILEVHNEESATI
ncbi:MAG: hypothetical protein GY810_20445 [Aureispira sp.]|nr:hypothetical protein [Aureispira sp.]